LFDELGRNLEKHRIVVLVSPAGFGKSTVAREFADQFFNSSDFKIARWFDADSEQKIMNAIEEILKVDLGVPYDDVKNLSESQKVIKLIQSIQQNERFEHLFIFDNIQKEEFRIIQVFRDNFKFKNLKFLLTTRVSELDKETTLKLKEHSIKPFNKTEALAYIEKRLQQRSSKKSLISDSHKKILLNHFLKNETDTINTYKLELASAFIMEEYQDMETRPKAFETLVAQIDKDAFDYVYKPFRDDDFSMNLLNFLAYLDPDSISRKMISF
jgi:hypothetical protein